MRQFELLLKSVLLLSTLDFVLYSSSALAADQQAIKPTGACPIAPTRVRPEINAQVSFDRATKLYTYRYEIRNSPKAQISVNSIVLAVPQEPSKLEKPARWTVKYKADQRPQNLRWTSIVAPIAPGSSQSGLSMQSSLPPGTTKFFAKGQTEYPVSVPVDGEKEGPPPNCPEFFFDAPLLEEFVLGMTTGPVAENQVSAQIQLRKKDAKPGLPIQLSAFDKGPIEVVIPSSDSLDAEQIELSKIRFGFGGAKPISTVFVDRNHKDGPGQGHLRHKRNLILTFNIEDIGFRCSRDHALFIEGKMKNGAPLLGGAEVEPELCTPKHFEEIKTSAAK